ncbi:hypothetical protein MPLDJ20_110009 [Mesorhizobium plurifarium]|uniref:Uncharacterized protein n=1 Tax=Mesorhizobium plurifarium TaxID=69974 RepID=A0A090DJ53_MESPL|nr:hypothetical protein MPLDJ20_110009 [Mesorhizobium plurifarium]
MPAEMVRPVGAWVVGRFRLSPECESLPVKTLVPLRLSRERNFGNAETDPQERTGCTNQPAKGPPTLCCASLPRWRLSSRPVW